MKEIRREEKERPRVINTCVVIPRTRQIKVKIADDKTGVLRWLSHIVRDVSRTDRSDCVHKAFAVAAAEAFTLLNFLCQKLMIKSSCVTCAERLLNPLCKRADIFCRHDHLSNGDSTSCVSFSFL
jgi:hypothetical protein